MAAGLLRSVVLFGVLSIDEALKGGLHSSDLFVPALARVGLHQDPVVADPPRCSSFHALMRTPYLYCLDNRRFSFADVCELRDDYPALYAGELPCPKLRKRDPRSQNPIRPMKGICRLRLGRKNALSRLCRERHTIARLESWALSRPF